MFILISPAKKLDLESPAPIDKYSECGFLDKSQSLIETLKLKDTAEIATLMSLSDKLAQLNVTRYQDFNMPFTTQNSKQALFTFKGDVYQAMQAETFTAEDIDFAQEHLGILSGLYGLLKPLDLMQAYRLEMGVKLTTEKGNTLYDFWDNQLTQYLNKLKVTTLINLASQEYFKSIQTKNLTAQVITPIFKELKQDKNGDIQYKVVGILAKRARGLMTRYIIENKITDVENIKEFDWKNYQYNAQLSNESEWIFTRDTA